MKLDYEGHLLHNFPSLKLELKRLRRVVMPKAGDERAHAQQLTLIEKHESEGQAPPRPKRSRRAR